MTATQTTDLIARLEAGEPRPATATQWRVLHKAVGGGGNIAPPQASRFTRRMWERMMKRLCAKGLFQPSARGGFDITQQGRDLYAALRARQA